LARSLADLSRIVELLVKKGASLRILNTNIDTSTASGKAFLGMLGVFAEFETNLRRERQLEGIAKAKAAGVYRGRPASIDADQVRQLKSDGKGATEIARAMGVGRASVYRLLAAAYGRGGPDGRGKAALFDVRLNAHRFGDGGYELGER
jgi:DNA invertase Pin-like site-specific DNA recombinase